jgi:hypothetical protein
VANVLIMVHFVFAFLPFTSKPVSGQSMTVRRTMVYCPPYLSVENITLHLPDPMALIFWSMEHFDTVQPLLGASISRVCWNETYLTDLGFSFAAFVLPSDTLVYSGTVTGDAVIEASSNLYESQK